MNILAVDSSTSKATVALWQDGRISEQMNINDSKTHSEKLLPMISEVIARSGLFPDSVDYYAVSVGPGSFTGLRIGITTVKAIAMTVEKPCVAVPSLDALAYNCKEFKGIICPVTDARNDQVFTSVYKGNGQKGIPERLHEYTAVHISELVSIINDLAVKNNISKVIFVGDAALKHLGYFRELLKNIDCAVASGGNLLADSASVAEVASYMISEGKTIDSDSLVPDYIRVSSAERIKQNGK